MDKDTYTARFAPDTAPGWEAIDAHLADCLPAVEPDFHFGTGVPSALGGPNPLDGISVYARRNPSHLHYVSYGLSHLWYSEEAAGGEFSGWGFELTFRLALDASDPPRRAEDVPMWPIGLMQNLAGYVFKSKKWFEQGHFINANGPIKAGSATDKTAIVFWNDPELPTTETPHGRLDFLQMVGITADELDELQAKTRSSRALIEEKMAREALLITTLGAA